MERAASIRPDAVTSSGASSARVLVVEDFTQLRESLVEGLTRVGFAADGAGSVREALDRRPETYDALVVDHRLGDALGTDLFRILADRDETFGLRFILMTADEHDLGLPTEVPVLLKPFRIAVLVAAVRRIHGGRAAPPDVAKDPAAE